MRLSLHRSGIRPDWLKIPVARRNRWQKLAHRTNGYVTPANIITFIGMAVALGGIIELLARHFWWAIVLLAAGRLLDIADGVVADKTGTKSALGELLDATVDKVVTVLTAAALFIAQTAPWWLLTVFILPHVVISAIVLYGRARHVRLHPSRLGKTTMLLVWIAVPLLLLVNALGLAWPHPLAILANSFMLTSAGFGVVTAYGYLPRSARP